MTIREISWITILQKNASVDQDRSIAETLQHVEFVADEDDRPSRGGQGTHGLQALCPKRGISHRQDFVDQHDFGIQVDHHRESKPGRHPA